MEVDVNGKIICPYNSACGCWTPECHKCGWNPKVSERRLAKIKEEMNELD